jgi:histidinol dehydrogenase
MFFGGVGARGCAPSIARCASFDMVWLLHLQVEPIVQSVRERGDAAVKEFTEKFDRATVDTVCVRIEVRGVLAT